MEQGRPGIVILPRYLKAGPLAAQLETNLPSYSRTVLTL